MMHIDERILRRKPARFLALALVALFVASSVLASVPPRQALAAPPGCDVSGSAYIADVNALGLVGTQIGATTLGQPGTGVGLNLNLLNLLNSLNTDTVSAVSTDTSNGGNAEVTSQATIAELNLTASVNLPLGLLGQLVEFNVLDISADAINVESKSNSANGFSGTTQVANLRIGNQTLNGAIPANTVIPITLNLGILGSTPVQVAKVTVNEQTFVNGALVVNGLHVEILDTNLPLLGALQVGDIVLGSATAKATCNGTNPSALAITGVSPAVGPTAGNQLVTIAGNGFTANTTVTFDATTVNPVGIAQDGTSLTVLTPAHSAGQVNVTVTNPGAPPTSATLTNGYTYADIPSGVGVTASCVNGAIQLTISGTNLLFGGLNLTPLISLNGNLLSNASLQSTNNAIVATIDPSLLDPVTNLVGISDPLGLLSPVLSLPLSIVGLNCLSTGAMSISSVIPNQGTTAGGTQVLISGANFPANVAVSFGGVAATAVNVQSPSLILAVTPPHAAGTVDVTVTEVGNPSNTATLANGFTYITPATIGNVSACISNGVAILTVTGTGFLPTTGLLLNALPVVGSAVTVDSTTQITAIVPALSLLPVNTLVAVNPVGSGNILSATLNLGTLPNSCPIPGVVGINPNQGPTDGGTVVTITGANFKPDTTVTFGGSAGTNVVVANGGGSLTVVTPPHAAGLVDVVVTNPTPVSQATTITNGFTYVASNNPSPGPSNSASPNPSPSNPGGGPSPSPSTPGGTEGTPPTLTGLFLVGTGQVPPTTNGRVTFLATIQDNAALGGIEASMSPTGPWQRVVDITSVGNSGNPYRVAGGFDTTNPAFGGSAAPGNKLVYIRAIDAQSNVSAAQTLTINYPSQVPTFNDVNGDPATVEAINQLTARGIIRGYGDGTFGPNDPTLRAQMAALISRSMGWGNEEHGNNFPDRGSVDDELWRQVGTLNFYGVARGYTDPQTCQSAGTTAPCYLPADQVTQIQTISFITRAMVTLGYWTAQPDNPALYPNVPASSGHRVDLATYVHYLGAVPGTSPSQDFLSADEPASRAFFARAEWEAVKWRENSANWGVIPRP